MVDVDGVISLFGAPEAAAGADAGEAIEGSFHAVEGIPHFLSATAAAHLLRLAALFELVWASGWEERADEHLPHLLGLPAGLPHLVLDRNDRPRRPPNAGVTTAGNWKLAAIEDFAGSRPLAWVDDALDESCHGWAARRTAPTLLVATEPRRGLTRSEAQELEAWALQLAG
jgi:HAD domain in Swiss Army Knife RNA repair proteins